MATTYNDLTLDIRRRLRQAGIEAATLEARELIKGRVLENALMSAREAAEALAPLTRSEVVQVIGTKFVLYRQSHRKDKKDKIVLVEGKKRESVPQREP